MEIETQIQIAVNLKFMEQSQANKMLFNTAEIGRMINGLSRSLKSKL
jgi:four helix bundle protein